jgi:hypothetical protein
MAVGSTWRNRVRGGVDQCLDRRAGSQEAVRRELAAWETHRHAAKATVDWRFTTATARRQLKHIYPL